MDAENFTKANLLLLGWREEESNGANGICAVMFVVRRRVQLKWSNGDWNKVIESHGQFSSMSILGDPRTVAYPDTREPVFMQAMQLVDGIYDGSIEDKLTNNAVYYADLSSKGFQKGGWFDRVILGNPERFPRCASIGSTTYFSDRGANYVPPV